MTDVPSDGYSATLAAAEARLVRLAYTMATNAHEGQIDKAGEPYIAHPIAVAEQVKHLGAPHQVVSCSTTPSRTPVSTLDQIKGAFGPAASEAVEALSRQEGETYLDFIRRAARNPVAATVKRADIEHNLSRPASLSASLEDRYRTALALLDQIEARPRSATPSLLAGL